MVALLIVEANQEQGLRWDLVQYLVALRCSQARISSLSDASRPMPIRCCCPSSHCEWVGAGDDSPPRPRRGPAGIRRVPRLSANQQMLWTWSASSASRWSLLPARSPDPGPLRLRVRTDSGPIRRPFGRAAAVDVRADGARSGFGCPASRIQPAEFRRLLLILRRRPAEPVHQRGQARPADGSARRATSPLAVDRVGRRDGVEATSVRPFCCTRRSWCWCTLPPNG